MSLTYQETEELSLLRSEYNQNKFALQKYESELLDTEMMIRNIIKKKSGRWVGFVITVILLVLVIISTYSYALMQLDSMADNENAFSALSFSVSTTELTFISLLLLFLFGLMIYTGGKLFMEKGTSALAIRLADRFSVNNYPTQEKYYHDRYNMQLKEIEEFKLKIKEIKARMDELESRETPWYEQ